MTDLAVQSNFNFRKPLQERFEKFHSENPHVYQTLVFMCKQYQGRDHKDKLGARALVEALRWDWRMRTTRDQDQPKINNDYSALYARLIMESEPDLEGIFEIRTMTQA